MTHKNRHVLGCYDTLNEVVDVIRYLKEKGFTNEEITLVTREDYVPQYANRTDVSFSTEEEVMSEAEPSEEETIWERVAGTFSVERHTNTPHTPDYRTDDDPLYAYQDNLDRGCVVVLVDGLKHERIQEEEPANQEEVVEPDPTSLLDATDAMRSNVIMSTGSDSVIDSGIAPEVVDEGNLHDHDSHTE
ncbi:general stress protein [Jeotgalibaca caeni]|uniref:general stress protein n=1 Tax=Jeotgalibaca caeni TaxID=3028623 RepID=UPI00237EA001|nr:general stress protein [Jeotgalibaca caeni]MDE1549455.1 general stress protein [Jeotgalibaca caeni]